MGVVAEGIMSPRVCLGLMDRPNSLVRVIRGVTGRQASRGALALEPLRVTLTARRGLYGIFPPTTNITRTMITRYH